MMKQIAILILVGSLCFPAVAANPSSNPGEVVWYGMDYTLVKFIGSSDQFSDIPKIRSYYFRSWNELILAEKQKYDLTTAFSGASITYNMEDVISRSENRNMEGIVQSGPYSIDEEQVREVVSLNIDASMDKVGAMFVMETLNKVEQKSTMWLAVFNVATGEILYMKRYTGAVGGFGFRNYWARSYYNVIKNLRVSPRKSS